MSGRPTLRPSAVVARAVGSSAPAGGDGPAAAPAVAAAGGASGMEWKAVFEEEVERCTCLAREAQRADLLGSSEAKQGLVRDWLRFFADLDRLLKHVISPNRGLFDKQALQVRAEAVRMQCALSIAAQAFAEARPALRAFDDALAAEAQGPFLLGEELTLADIVGACTVGDALLCLLPAAVRERYPAVFRWLRTCLDVPAFGLAGGFQDLRLCEWPAEEEQSFKKRAGDAFAKLSSRRLLSMPKRFVREGGALGVLRPKLHAGAPGDAGHLRAAGGGVWQAAEARRRDHHSRVLLQGERLVYVPQTGGRS